MPRPTNKSDLLTAMQTEHDALVAAVAHLTPEQVERTSTLTGYAIKDVLAHITEWEQMCLSWYQAGLRGHLPELPAPGFKWSETPALNQQIYETHREESFVEIWEQFDISYQLMRQTLLDIPEEILFTPGHYAWTRQNNMATYFISATSSHYNWGRKEVKKCLKG